MPCEGFGRQLASALTGFDPRQMTKDKAKTKGMKELLEIVSKAEEVEAEVRHMARMEVA